MHDFVLLFSCIQFPGENFSAFFEFDKISYLTKSVETLPSGDSAKDKTRRSQLNSPFKKRTRCHSFVALNRASDVPAADWQQQQQQQRALFA